MAALTCLPAHAVPLEPESTRYRWALIGILRKLDRDAQVRPHTWSILKRASEVGAYGERRPALLRRE